MTRRRQKRIGLYGGCLLSVIAVSCGCRPARTSPIAPSSTTTQDAGASNDTPKIVPAAVVPIAQIQPIANAAPADENVAPTDGGVRDAAPPPAVVVPPQPPAKVKIGVRAIPKAAVSWGSKPLGITPITIERPRDSGPMDLVLRAKGYLPVHTRLYTWKSDSWTVQMTKLEDAQNILGAKKAPPPEPGAPGATTPGQPTPGAPAAGATPDGGAAK